MEGFIHDAAAFIARHGVWAGPLLGLMTFGESLVLVGAFVPATALMAATGVLVATDALSPAPVLFWGCVGAVLGEALSYHLGRRAGPAIWRHRRLRSQRKSVARARLYFRRYGATSIFLGRFLGPLQAVVPLTAGATGMHQGRFHVANILSALIWTPAMLAPGYVAAGGLDGWSPPLLSQSSSLVPGITAVAVMVLGCLLILESLFSDRRGWTLHPI
jgi:membrane protein DedA with SNARE-associated domain